MYKKLEADALALTKVENAIKSKLRELKFARDEWLYYEKLEIDDEADRWYQASYKAEVDLRNLSNEAHALRQKVKKNAGKKA